MIQRGGGGGWSFPIQKFMLPFFETLNRALWWWNWYKMVNRSRNDLDQLLLWMVPTANYGQLIQIIIPTQKYDKLFHYMVQTVLLFNGLVELSILNLGNPTPIAKYGSSPSLCGPIDNWRRALSAPQGSSPTDEYASQVTGLSKYRLSTSRESYCFSADSFKSIWASTHWGTY